MKGFAIVLLCVVAAVQGRSTGVKVVNEQRSLAALGENPWVVHLRLAVATSGFLNSCAGALIDNSWVLTSAHCLDNMRFVWVRFGAVQVIRPELVLETTNVHIHGDWNHHTSENNVALIDLNRVVEITANIAPIGLPSASIDFDDTASYCAYGETEHSAPGERLSCWDVTTVAINNHAAIVEGEGIVASRFDSGAPLVSEGTLVGLLDRADEHNSHRAVFTRTSAHVRWISGMTGVDFSRAGAAEGSLDVIFVN